MSIELTEAQRQAVKNGDVVRLSAPEIGEDVVLVQARLFEEIRELLEDEKEQKAFREAGLRSAIEWMKENPY